MKQIQFFKMMLLLLAGIFLFGFFACGGSSTDGTVDTPDDDTYGANTVTIDELDEFIGKDVKILIGQTKDAIQKAKDMFDAIAELMVNNSTETFELKLRDGAIWNEEGEFYLTLIVDGKDEEYLYNAGTAVPGFDWATVIIENIAKVTFNHPPMQNVLHPPKQIVVPGASVNIKMTDFIDTKDGLVYTLATDPGNGSSGNPFKVYNVETLKKVGTETAAGGWRLDAHYIQTANITLPAPVAPATSNWIPIGDNNINHDSYRFSGTYNGSGYTITGLTIHNTTGSLHGFFGYIIASGTVKNVSLVNCFFDNSTGVTGAIAATNYGTMENCRASGNISGSGSSYHTGGLVGQNYGILESCSFTGTNGAASVRSKDGNNAGHLGGVVGSNYGVMRSCFATIDVTCGVGTNSYRVGGVAGYNEGTIENCYATGNITGSRETGGVVGENSGTSVLKTSYATGNVTGTGGTNIGGVIGYNNANAVVQNCFATGKVESSNDSVGGVVGQSLGLVQNCYATGNVKGNDYIGGVVGRLTVGGPQTVQNCYSTGEVEGNNYVGGIAGYNASGAVIRNCVAFSPDVKSTRTSGNVIGRIISSGGVLSNNYARSDMKFIIYGATSTPTGGAHDSINGANITSTDWYNSSWWNNAANWNTTGSATAWDFTSTGAWNPPVGTTLPTLRGMPNFGPVPAQNPIVVP